MSTLSKKLDSFLMTENGELAIQLALVTIITSAVISSIWYLL